MSSAMGGSDFIRGRKNVSQRQKQRDRRFFVSFSVCMHLVRFEIDATLVVILVRITECGIRIVVTPIHTHEFVVNLGFILLP